MNRIVLSLVASTLFFAPDVQAQITGGPGTAEFIGPRLIDFCFGAANPACEVELPPPFEAHQELFGPAQALDSGQATVTGTGLLLDSGVLQPIDPAQAAILVMGVGAEVQPATAGFVETTLAADALSFGNASAGILIADAMVPFSDYLAHYIDFMAVRNSVGNYFLRYRVGDVTHTQSIVNPTTPIKLRVEWDATTITYVCECVPLEDPAAPSWSIEVARPVLGDIRVVTIGSAAYHLPLLNPIPTNQARSVFMFENFRSSLTSTRETYWVSNTPLSLDGTLYPNVVWLDDGIVPLDSAHEMVTLDGVTNINVILTAEATVYTSLTPAELTALYGVTVDGSVLGIFQAQGYGADYIWSLSQLDPAALVAALITDITALYQSLFPNGAQQSNSITAKLASALRAIEAGDVAGAVASLNLAKDMIVAEMSRNKNPLPLSDGNALIAAIDQIVAIIE